MTETLWQKFVKHYKSNGLFYAIKRGFRYIAWRNRCVKAGVDWRKFAR